MFLWRRHAIYMPRCNANAAGELCVRCCAEPCQPRHAAAAQPKLVNHFNACHSQTFTCVDCSRSFNRGSATVRLLPPRGQRCHPRRVAWWCASPSGPQQFGVDSSAKYLPHRHPAAYHIVAASASLVAPPHSTSARRCRHTTRA